MPFRFMLFKKRSILITWLLSYFAVLVIPIAASSIVYATSTRIIEDEILSANTYMLKQVDQVVEKYLDDIGRLNMQITWNNSIQRLIYSSDSSESNFQFMVREAANELKNLENSYGFVDGFYLYIHKYDIAIIPGVYRDSQLLYETVHDCKGGMSYKQWINFLQEKHNRDLVSIMRKTEDGSEKRSIALISSIPTGGNDAPMATVVIMLDVSKIMNSVESAQLFSNGGIYIFNNRGQEIASKTALAESVKVDREMLTDDEGLIYGKYGGKEHVLTYISSKKYGWKYVSVIPNTLFWKKAVSLRNLMYLSILLSVIGGVLLTYFFAKKNYGPISKLIAEIANRMGLPYDMGSNEYGYIEKAVHNTLTEKEKVAEMIRQQNYVLKASLLTRLLKGDIDSNIPLEESFSAFDIQFESNSFGVLLFYIKHTEMVEMAGQDMSKSFKLIQFAITNVAEELAGQHNIGMVTEIDNMMACIINFKDGFQGDYKDEMLRISHELQKFMAENFKTELTISVSSIYSTVTGISHAYQEAVKAMEYSLVLAKGEVTCYDDIPAEAFEGSKYTYYYPLMTEQQLINSIKTGDFSKACEILDHLFSLNFDHSGVSAKIAKYLMFDMVSTIIKTINEIGDQGENQFIEAINPMSRFAESQSIIDMKNEMTNIIGEVCEYTSQKRKSIAEQQRDNANKELVKSIISYISNNFSNLDLNISGVALKHGMSSSYISKIFKEQTGEGMLDYINKYRVNKAKDLLRTSGTNIGEIAQKVGFSDSNSFIRIFKRYEGITPGKYKEVNYTADDKS